MNFDQIEEHRPPPNPAKVTDPRAASYIATHGDASWELDALEPNVIVELIEQHIKGAIDDEDDFEERRRFQATTRKKLRKVQFSTE